MPTTETQDKYSKLSPLARRKLMEEEQEARFARSLTSQKPYFKAKKLEKQRKKKTTAELLKMIERCRSVRNSALRPADTYVPKSYNLDRQIQGLINHLYVKYPVPSFLYKVFLKDNGDPFHYMRNVYQEWFVILAQGGRFNKHVKGIMTSREAAMFLRAPSEYHVHENVWWAKMRVAGMPESITRKLINRIFRNHYFDDPDGRLAEVINFYLRFYKDMDKDSFEEITDFIAWQLVNRTDFRYKGRTITSMIALSNQWHVLMQKAKLGEHISWPGMNLTTWSQIKEPYEWHVYELTTNKDLMEEGKKQKHCVYSYVRLCVAGECHIFSLRRFLRTFLRYDDKGDTVYQYDLCDERVTIEVEDRTIVQMKSKLNAYPSDEEIDMIRHWCGVTGLTLRARNGF